MKGTWTREYLQVPGATVMSLIGGEEGFAALLKYSMAEYVMLSFVGAWPIALLNHEHSLSEDGLRKNEFRKQWVDYARRVPWRMLPFVY